MQGAQHFYPHNRHNLADSHNHKQTSTSLARCRPHLRSMTPTPHVCVPPCTLFLANTTHHLVSIHQDRYPLQYTSRPTYILSSYSRELACSSFSRPRPCNENKLSLSFSLSRHENRLQHKYVHRTKPLSTTYSVPLPKLKPAASYIASIPSSLNTPISHPPNCPLVVSRWVERKTQNGSISPIGLKYPPNTNTYGTSEDTRDISARRPKRTVPNSVR